MSDERELEERIDSLRATVRALQEAVGAVFLGHREVVDQLLFAVLAGGHVLLEGAPGLGKTTLVRGVSNALDLSFRRVQFTPDLMPADILGTRVLEETPEGGRHFHFQRGPVFTNVLLADEINRATPRTQSALLESMQEHQVTIFGETHALEEPFCVIATQNPIEMEGTYPLPEAQLDRFLLKVELPSPGLSDLIAILDATTQAPVPSSKAIVDREQLNEMCGLVRGVPVSREIVELVARLVRATHATDDDSPPDVRRFVRYGSSPRGGQALLMCAKARALVRGRLHVAMEDIEDLAGPALRHRLILGYEGEASGVHPDALIAEALHSSLNSAQRS